MRKRPAFTLMELMIAIGLIGILSTIVILGLSPQRQLSVAQDAKRVYYSKTLENAVAQYVIDNGTLPEVVGDAPVSSNPEEPTPVCKFNVAISDDCINLDALVTENYVASIPVDEIASFEVYDSGYSVYVEAETGRVRVSYRGGGGGIAGGTTGGGSSAGSSSSQSSAPSGPTPPGPIATCEELQNIELVGEYYLANDIDCTGIYFDPIGMQHNPFRGTFDGNGHVITNLNLDPTTEGGSAALFAGLSGLITRVGIVDAAIEATGMGNAKGLLVARSDEGVVRDVYATGTINGDTNVGGLIGIQMGGTVERVYADVVIRGGFAAIGSLISFVEEAVLKDSFATDDVQAVGIGSSFYAVTQNPGDNSDVTNVFWNNSPAGPATYCGTVGCTTISNNLPYFYESSNEPMASWDFANVWQENPGAFPTLRTGEEAQSISISTCEELDAIGVDSDMPLDGEYFINQDLFCEDIAFTPIGSSTSHFTGSLNGLGHTIYDLNVTASTPSIGGGIFSHIDGGSVTNLIVEAFDVYAPSVAGGLAGFLMNGATISDVTILNGTVSGPITSGGLAGSVASSDITHVRIVAVTTVGGSYGGGIVGSMVGGSLVHSASVENIISSASTYAGGIVGRLQDATLTNVMAQGSITANSSIKGGIAGWVSNSDINFAYANEDINASMGQNGGLAGAVAGASSIENSFAVGTMTSGGVGTKAGIACTAIAAQVSNTVWLSGTSSYPTQCICGAGPQPGSCSSQTTASYFYEPENSPLDLFDFYHSEDNRYGIWLDSSPYSFPEIFFGE